MKAAEARDTRDTKQRFLRERRKKVKPSTETELSQAVADAAAAGQALRIVGGDTRDGLGGAVSGETLETGGLSGITLYEPGALTLVAQAGTPVEEIEAALAAEGQILPFEPMDHRGMYGTQGKPTIGGVVAANISGPRRIQAGACRDSLIGVRFVDGRGEVIKNGGRVMKNVTGYDVVKLMCGSHGTLGVLSEVSLKVLPRAEAAATVTVDGLDAQAACKAMAAALGSPFDVTGAAHLVSENRTLVRVEGFAGSVAYRAEALKSLLAQYGDTASTDDTGDWAAIRDATPVLGEGEIWRISVKPADGAAVINRISPLAALLDWGGGLVWVRVSAGTDLRAALGDIQGHATLVRATDEQRARVGTFHPEAAAIGRIAAGLRDQFDPSGILNPGRMG